MSIETEEQKWRNAVVADFKDHRDKLNNLWIRVLICEVSLIVVCCLSVAILRSIK